MARKRIIMKTNIDRGPLPVTESPRSDHLKFEDFFNLYEKFLEVKKLEGISDRTLEDYEKHLDYITVYLTLPARSDEDRAITVEKIRAYQAYMLHEKQYKPTTINIRLRTLKAYFHWLYEEDYIDSKLYKSIKLMRTPVDLAQPLNKKEIKMILSAPDKTSYNGYRDYSLMLLMLDTGIRVKEAVNLQIDDVDIKRGVIIVRGETAKTRSFRELPISPNTSKGLRELIKISKEYKNNYVFLNELGSQISPKTVGWCFRNYGRKIGIKKRCTPHVFRHTFATNFIRKGGDVFTLQRIMGHSTLLTTRRYIQLDIEDLKKKHQEFSLLEEYS